MNGAPGDNGPCGGFVEGDILIERNDVVQRGPAEQGNEITADGE